jgi:type VI secretion system secreted protein Hcp
VVGFPAILKRRRFMKRQLVLASALALLAVVFLRSAAAAAQADVFVRFSDFQGESTDDKHKDWIDAQLLADGMTMDGTGKSIQKSLVFTKKVDKATPRLKLYLLQEKRIPEVQIEVVKSGGKQNVLYSIKLRSVTVTSVKTTIQNGVSVEEVSLDFAIIEWTYFEYGPDGSSKGSTKTGWNLEQNKAT